MIIARTSRAIVFQCARFSIGVAGTISNITGQVTNSFFPTPRAIMTDARSKYGPSFNLPPFTVSKESEEYEERHYQKAFWVSTTSSGAPMSNSSTMFMKLFRYIQGANKRNEMISMTVPVMTEVKEGNRNNNLKMSFYIPDDFQKDPPAPSDPSVFIEEKEFTAFVRSFGGYPMFFSQYRKHIDTMIKAMTRDGLGDKYRKGVFMYAGYDQPWKMFDRLNEVLLVKETEE